LVSWLFGLSVIRLWLFGYLVCRLFGLYGYWLYGLSVIWLFGYSVCRLFGYTVCRLYGLSVIWFYGLSVIRFVVIRLFGLSVSWFYVLHANRYTFSRPSRLTDIPSHHPTLSLLLQALKIIKRLQAVLTLEQGLTSCGTKLAFHFSISRLAVCAFYDFSSIVEHSFVHRLCQRCSYSIFL